MTYLYFIAHKGSKAKTPLQRLWYDEYSSFPAFPRKKDAFEFIKRSGIGDIWEVVSVKFDPK